MPGGRRSDGGDWTTTAECCQTHASSSELQPTVHLPTAAIDNRPAFAINAKIYRKRTFLIEGYDLSEINKRNK